MGNKVKIEVFGIKDDVVSCDCNNGECNCKDDGGCNCCSCRTVGELYGELVNFLNDSKLNDNFVISFIDLLEDATEKYAVIEDLLERGFELPFIFINDVVKLYGSMSNQFIYEYAEEALQNKIE